MEWDTKYKLNIKSIDDQHKVFFDIWNNLDKMTYDDKEGQARIVEQLANYMKIHFTYEEKLMKEAAYPDLEEHMKMHVFFGQKIHEMSRQLNYMNPFIYAQTKVFFKKWFIYHILQVDKNYKECVSSYLNEIQHDN